MKNHQRLLISHPRSTVGGLVIRKRTGAQLAYEITQALVTFAEIQEIDEIIFRQPFRLFNREQCDQLDQAFWRCGGILSSRSTECVIPLIFKDEIEFMNHINSKTRNQIKKAKQSGVIFRQTKDYGFFWSLLESNLARQHDVKPVHSLEAIVRLRDSTRPGEVELHTAYFQDRLIAGILILRANELAIHAQYIAAEKEFSSLNATAAIIAHICIEAKQRGFRYFNLGTANENGGLDANWGLFKFKENFAPEHMLRETMSLRIKSKGAS